MIIKFFRGISVVTSFVLLNVISFISSADNHSIELVSGLSKPPFVIEENDSGMQLDIIREAFKTENIEVKFIHLPLARTITGFQRWDVDGVITLPEDYQHPGMFLSAPYISYQNVAVTLNESALSINSVADLSGKSVAAFQNAKKFLGDNYNKVLAYSLDYREIADQSKQITMLYSRQAEVIVLDVNIFKHFLRKNSGAMYHKAVNIHYIFDERLYVAGFKNEGNRDRFDRGIRLIKDNGTYQATLDRYLQ